MLRSLVGSEMCIRDRYGESEPIAMSHSLEMALAALKIDDDLKDYMAGMLADAEDDPAQLREQLVEFLVAADIPQQDAEHAVVGILAAQEEKPVPAVAEPAPAILDPNPSPQPISEAGAPAEAACNPTKQPAKHPKKTKPKKSGAKKRASKATEQVFDVDGQGAVGDGEDYALPVAAGALKKGDFCVLKGHPCRLSEVIQKEKATGQTANQRFQLVGLHIWTGKKYVDTLKDCILMEVPVVHKREYTLLDIDTYSGCISVLTDVGETKDDLNLPGSDEEQYISAGEKLKVLFEEGTQNDKEVFVSTLTALGREIIVDCRIEI
eukprot:TRINITY_DN4280_c0_g1_i2.p1 TRINITY_DN4280_c0_g1~~TRINITY_DN4280_c0_g1_i2.p1  ORF type:complete len:322 (-),score=102.03 TRINITY_DN4280_c0_g1_i2:71-1036(-)